MNAGTIENAEDNRYCPPCPIHNYPQFSKLYVSVQDVADLFKVSQAQVYKLVKKGKFWHSRATGPIRTTIEDVCYSITDINLRVVGIDEQEWFIENCKSMYETHLKLNPNRREHFEKFVKPTLDESLRILAEYWVAKKQKVKGIA